MTEHGKAASLRRVVFLPESDIRLLLAALDFALDRETDPDFDPDGVGHSLRRYLEGRLAR